MNNEEYLLTFELSKGRDEIHICADAKGLEEFIRELSNLLGWSKENKTEHIHLMTDEWGGHELSSTSQIGEIVNHVKIYCSNDEQMTERAKIVN